MRQILSESELEQVTGGVVNIYDESMHIVFTSTREFYDLENCTYEEAISLAARLENANKGVSQAELDDIIKCAFIDNEWICE